MNNVNALTRGRQRAAGVICALLCVPIFIQALSRRAIVATPLTEPYGELYSFIRINEAPWHDLTRLPNIGRRRAQAIVAYRQAVRETEGERATVFRTAADLQRVPGIGPVIAEGCAPYLDFGTGSDNGSAPH